MAYTVNDCNIVVDADKIVFGKRKGYCIPTIEIKVAEHKGRWFMALSGQLPHEGFGRGVSITEGDYNPSYASRDSAVEQGKKQALDWLHGRVAYYEKHGRPESHIQCALTAIQEIEESCQLTLF